MTELVGAFKALVGQVVLPDPALISVNASAYVEAYNACAADRSECVRMFSKMLDEVKSGVRTWGLEVDLAGYKGYAETVLSKAPDPVKLMADGKAYAEVVGACVQEPVACVERGKHWHKNRQRRLRKTKVGTSQDGKVSEVEESLGKRRVAENALAVRKAEAALAALSDPIAVKLRADIERKRCVVRAGLAAIESEKVLSDLSSVSPGSSASQYEVREMERKMEALDHRAYIFEDLAREYAPPGEVKARLARVAPVVETEGVVGVSGTLDLLRECERGFQGANVDVFGVQVEEEICV